MSDTGRGEVSLEERFETLRSEGLEVQAAVRKIFEEDINADVKELVRITGLDNLSIGRIKGRVVKAQKGRAGAPPSEKGETSPYKGETDVTEVLSSVLEGHPDIPEKVREEVLRVSDLKGGLHPMELPYVLSSMKGIASNTANIVSWKYSLALQKAQTEGKLALPFQWMGMTGMTQQQQAPTGLTVPGLFPTGIPGMQAGGQQPGLGQPYLTRDEFLAAEEKRRRDDDMKTLRDESKATRDRLEKIDRDFAGALETLGETLEEKLSRRIEDVRGGQFEEVTEFIDAKGNLCKPEEAASTRVRRVPVAAAVAAKGESAIDVLVKLREADLIPGSSKVTLEDVRRVVKEEGPKTPTETITKEDLTKATEDAARKAREEAEKEAERREAEERRHRETLEAIRQSRPPPSGVTTPEGVIATAITEAGRKEPVRIIVEGAKDILGPGSGAAPPPGGTAGEAARGGVLQELRRHGLVARVSERVR